MERRPLTQTDIKTAKWLSDGYTAKEMARFDDVSEQAIKKRCTAIYFKLGARNARQAVAIAFKQGYINGITFWLYLLMQLMPQPMRTARLHKPAARVVICRIKREEQAA